MIRTRTWPLGSPQAVRRADKTGECSKPTNGEDLTPAHKSSLRTWGLKLKERIGFKRAAIAVARKLAVVMHAMLRPASCLTGPPAWPLKPHLAKAFACER